jgi:A/G-specific adenine glycosylase
LDARSIRKKLIRWYEHARRDLPWRRTQEPYSIWISEIMLQQTRVAAVIPYYERFLARFPNPAALAAAREEEVLALWSGLGYYSRARNLQKAARQIVDAGEFPATHAELLQLAGIGSYTAAAIASISFGLPHAVVDGNVRRVFARLTNNANVDTQGVADTLLDRQDPARWNQAVMELGALICTPKSPRCGECPLAPNCLARAEGTQAEVPGKKIKPAMEFRERTLLVIRRGGKLLLMPSDRVQGFWDLPEPFPGARLGEPVGAFTHSITHRRYTFTVRTATGKAPAGGRWFAESQLNALPVGTTAKKALKIAYNAR